MAQITANADAPAEKVHYIFAGAEFDLDAKGVYKTDDVSVIESCAIHPWLTVSDDVPAPAPAAPKTTDTLTTGVEN